MPETITQEELRRFCRLTVLINREIEQWAQMRADISTRITLGAEIEPGEIKLDMLAIDAEGEPN